jgi:hypothetical protein
MSRLASLYRPPASSSLASSPTELVVLRWGALIVAFVHAAVAIGLREGRGLTIAADPIHGNWDWFMQTLPAEALQRDLLGSLWYLHSQPPLFNLWGGIFLKLFPANHLTVIHWAQIGLGAGLCGLLALILYGLTGQVRLALPVALILALNPALFLYEAYLLYPLLTAFLVVLSVFCLLRYHEQRRLRAGAVFLLVLNLLILTRSSYHLLLLIPAIGLVCLLAGRRARQMVLIGLLISLLSLGWYAKNYLLFGFAGASSWAGQNLWRIASGGIDPAQLVALAPHAGLDAMVVETPVFSPPSAYERYGFVRRSPIAVLARDDDNNLNVVDIARRYGRNAWRLIAYDPLRYLRNIGDAYGHFSQPSARYEHLALNAAKLGWYETLSSDFVQGRRWLGQYGTFQFFLLPATLFVYLGALWRRHRLHWRSWIAYLQADPVMVFTAGLITYSTLVSCLFELGENQRFKFDVEALIWLFITATGYRLIQRQLPFTLRWPTPLAEVTSLESRTTRTGPAWVMVMLVSAGTLLLLFGLNMRRGVNHDEHQFVAAGKLVAQGLSPYADFPYFHAPTLAYLYAALFPQFPALLWTARLSSILCGWLTVLLCGLLAYRRLTAPLRLPVAACVMMVLVATPLFAHTSGRAWNHDLPMLLLLLALGLAWTPGIERRWVQPTVDLLTGLLLGLAASTRLSFALLAPAFVLTRWLIQTPQAQLPHVAPRHQWPELARQSLLFVIGWGIGFAPALWLAGHTPEAFFFGNVEYISLNTAYYQNLPQPPDSMTLIGKLLYFLRLMLLQPGNLLFLAAFIVLVWPSGVLRPAAGESTGEPPVRLSNRPWLLALLLGLAFVGALSPTPSQWQYFYPILPLGLIGAVERLRQHPLAVQRQRLGWLTGLTVVAALVAIPIYAPALAILATPAEWMPSKLHARSAEIATLADGGRVLTVAPLYPLEQNTPIEPALATGPFAWRVAEQVEPARRARLGLLAPADLPAYWEAQPPRALLTGVEADDAVDEAPLVAQAQAQGYVPVPLTGEGTLWLAPIANWGDTIQLGGQTLPPTPVAPGTDLVATFYLQAVRPIAQNLNVQVRLVNGAGVELWRADGWPWGAATSTWLPGQVWPDGHTIAIPPNVAPGVYRAEMSFYDPATLATVGDVQPVGYLLVGEPVAAPVNALAYFGDQIALVAATINQGGDTPLRPGAARSIRLTWQALQRPTADYTAFVHILGPDGQLVAQQDRPPLNGFYPTRQWRPNFPLTEEIVIALPMESAPGSYRVLVGLYEPSTLQRLSIIQQGQPTGDALPVGEFTVGQ